MAFSELISSGLVLHFHKIVILHNVLVSNPRLAWFCHVICRGTR